MIADLMDSQGPSRADLEELERIEHHRRVFTLQEPEDEHQTVVRGRLLQLYADMEEALCEEGYRAPFLAEAWQRVDELEKRYWEKTIAAELQADAGTAASPAKPSRPAGARRPAPEPPAITRKAA